MTKTKTLLGFIFFNALTAVQICSNSTVLRLFNLGRHQRMCYEHHSNKEQPLHTYGKINKQLHIIVIYNKIYANKPLQ